MSAVNDARPTLVFLHALGASKRSWGLVIAALGEDFDCVALDLPGFGDEAASGRLTIEETLDALSQTLSERVTGRWMVVGHSMGAKFATLLARRGAKGESELTAPAGVVLVAGSPPSPEPMDEKRRASMIDWWANGRISHADAERFVDANTARTLAPEVKALAVADVERTARAAWLAWLERGSLEDWSASAGPLSMPALLVAGAKDADLGERNQRALNGPHYLHHTVEVVPNAAHLIPLEQPEALAALIAKHWRSAGTAPVAVPDAFLKLIASDRVSEKTRQLLLQRLDEPPREAQVLTLPQRALLNALLAPVLPQRGAQLDLAAYLDVNLATNKGDGWRFAELPPDVDACRRGVDTLAALLDGADFASLALPQKHEWIRRLMKGEAGIADDERYLSPKQMKLWFEDLRGEAAQIYVAHPATLARIGYDGFAVGGDGARKQGYLRTHADEREAWQEDWQKLSESASS